MSRNERPVFGDPRWIALRGPSDYRPPPRMRRGRRRANRYQPIYVRVEGEWKRLFCKACKSPSWTVIEEEPPFVYLACPLGHEGGCMQGFRGERPDEESVER